MHVTKSGYCFECTHWLLLCCLVHVYILCDRMLVVIENARSEAKAKPHGTSSTDNGGVSFQWVSNDTRAPTLVLLPLSLLHVVQRVSRTNRFSLASVRTIYTIHIDMQCIWTFVFVSKCRDAEAPRTSVLIFFNAQREYFKYLRRCTLDNKTMDGRREIVSDTLYICFVICEGIERVLWRSGSGRVHSRDKLVNNRSWRFD